MKYLLELINFLIKRGALKTNDFHLLIQEGLLSEEDYKKYESLINEARDFDK